MSTPAVVTNITPDVPITILRGTSLPLNFSLAVGTQPVLPTDAVPLPADLSPSGTYLLFMVKPYDVDPDTGKAIPDSAALLSLDSRASGIIISFPFTTGKVIINIDEDMTTTVDSFGNFLMPDGVDLRWSLKLFLGDGNGGVSSEHIPLRGPWTVYDGTVQKTV